MINGFQFTEGPVWHPTLKRLIFSDIAGDVLYVTTLSGQVEIYRKPSNMTNGNTFDREGRLLSCEHATSRVVRTELDGKITVLATHWRGKQLNSPNDIVVARDGMIYFSDPIYGRMAFYGVEREPELDFRGVFTIHPTAGKVSLIADDFDQPNGLCLSLDEARLFVSDTRRAHIRVFDLGHGHSPARGQIWAETTGDEPGTPDGLKIDSVGNLYSCGPGGIHVFDPGATCLGVIHTPQEAANFTWAGRDLKTLVITAGTALYRVAVGIPGLRIV